MSAHRLASRATRRPAPVRTVVLGVVLSGALVATLTAADLRESGAWFTAEQSTSGNSLGAATVKVAGVGPDLTPDAKLQVANILPLSATDATDGTKGPRLDLVVRNTGSVPVNWTLALKNVATTSGSVDLGAITNVSFTTNGGTTWSSPAVKLGALANPGISGSNLAPGAKVTVTLRFWFDKDVTNDAQGAKAEFTTLLSAIQTGAD